MLRFCSKRLELLAFSYSSIAVDYSVTQFQKAPHFARLYSSQSSLVLDAQYEKNCSFTVSYLINSFGFSPEVALSLSKKRHVQFESPERPDAVVKLLKGYGLSDTLIACAVKKLPSILCAKAEEILMPKLEFFGSIGIKGTDLTQLVCGSPSILRYSLNRNLRPCYDIIRTLPIHPEKIGLFMKNVCRSLNVKMLSNAASNLSFLRSLQLPESSITLCDTYCFIALSRETAKFKVYVEKVLSMGFLPSSAIFVRAIYVISLMNGNKWAQRKKFYRKWGWTEDDILSAFRKSPSFMFLTEKNVAVKLDCFMNKMGWQPADVVEHPGVLTYSLEKWILPRCSVIIVLQLKGLVRKGEFSLGRTIMYKKEQFLDRFVNKYDEQVPELMSIFQRKVGLAELGLGFEERDIVKQV